MTASRIFTSLRNELIAFLLFMGMWSVAAIFYPVYIIPSPMAVAASYPAYLPQDFPYHMAVTVIRIGFGFGIAFIVGSLLGILVFIKKWSLSVNAFMSALNVLPGMVLGVIFLLVFGIGNATPIALIAFLTLPTVTINTVNGLAKRDLTLEQYLTSINAQRGHFIKYLYLPALVPTLLSNLSIGMGLAIKVVLMGEFIGSQDGLGYLLNTARITFDMKAVFFYLVILLLFTLLFQAGLSLLSNTVLRKYFYS
jgi:NitT/TauT family transport system permease protein